MTHFLIVVSFLLVSPFIAHAAVTDMASLYALLTQIFDKLYVFLLTLSVALFIWGLVKFIANTSDTAAHEAGKKFIADFSLTFPNALDPSGRVSVDYGVYGVPETFFIDRRGRIRAKHVGAVTDDSFRHQVERLLAEQP